MLLVISRKWRKSVDLGAGGNQSLAGVVAGVLYEVLYEAASQVLGLGVPLGGVGVGVPGSRMAGSTPGREVGTSKPK